MLKTDNKRSNYTVVIIILSFLMVMVSLGFTSSTKSLFPDEIAESLNTYRSLVTIGETCRYISTAIVNLFFGFLVAKFGPKKLICAGFATLTASMLLYSFADHLIFIYIGGCLWGIGLSFTATTMVGYIVGMWCTRNKGTIMGAILASNGIGGAVAVQIVGRIIKSSDYRKAYLFIALVLAVTTLILIIFLRDKPKDLADAPKIGHKKQPKRGKDWKGIPFSEATRKFYFWGALICIFFSGTILQGSHGIVKMHLEDVGINYNSVINLMSFGMIILVSAKFLTGFIYDRLGLRITASACTGIAIASTFLLALIKGNDVGFILAVIYSILSQYAMPLETVMLPIYAADLFGKESYPKILGIFVSVNTAGYALGSPLMNICYDIWGTYVPALILVASLMCCIFILLQVVITLGHKEQRRVERLEAEAEANAETEAEAAV